jgi:uncharacterized spore protein YtfJ
VEKNLKSFAAATFFLQTRDLASQPSDRRFGGEYVLRTYRWRIAKPDVRISSCGEKRSSNLVLRSSQMSSQALLESLKENILSQASVKAIYGEPVSAHGKTVIPVAKIAYAYGAGAGTGGVGDTSARGEGGGGGGGVRAVPVGVIQISEQQTCFVPITDRKTLTGAVLAGMALGMVLGWRRRR